VDGGLLVLPDDELNRRARLLRWFGIDRDTDRLRKAPDVEEWGYKFHMNDVNAAIGLANLAGTDEVLRRHRDNAAFYDEQLAGVPGLDQIHRAEYHSPSYWVYPVRVRDRAAFVKRMDDAGIGVSQVHERNDRHPCVREYRALLPGMDQVADELICVPVGWWLSGEDRQYIADTIRAGW
jgi:dTDP-4-amino-4,6-dideoxygalactose transaminase